MAGHFVPNVPLPEPMLNVYPATKHAVTALTETLRKELIRVNSKIKVSVKYTLYYLITFCLHSHLIVKILFYIFF